MAGIIVLIEISVKLLELIRHVSHGETKALIRCVESKIEVLVATLLEDRARREVEKNSKASGRLHAEIKALCRIIQKTKQMKYLLYLFKHKKIHGQVMDSMGNIEFCMTCLLISKTSQPSPPADDSDLLSILKSEQQKCAELEGMVQNHRIDVDRIQKLAYIESQDDIVELVVQLSEEQSKLCQQQEHKALLEASYMKQIISVLCVVPASQPPPPSPRESSIVKLPECPISHEPLHDPVMANGTKCRCIFNRESLRECLEGYNMTNCPRCLSPLLDSTIFPVPELRDLIEQVSDHLKATPSSDWTEGMSFDDERSSAHLSSFSDGEAYSFETNSAGREFNMTTGMTEERENGRLVSEEVIGVDDAAAVMVGAGSISSAGSRLQGEAVAGTTAELAPPHDNMISLGTSHPTNNEPRTRQSQEEQNPLGQAVAWTSSADQRMPNSDSDAVAANNAAANDAAANNAAANNATANNATANNATANNATANNAAANDAAANNAAANDAAANDATANNATANNATANNATANNATANNATANGAIDWAIGNTLSLLLEEKR